MRFDLAFLVESQPVLPPCTWEDFCQDVGIESADMGKAFLDALGARMRSNGEADLPACVRGRARNLERDPYILWVWTLSSEFRREPKGTAMLRDPHIADHHYLVNVMRKECKGAGRDWAELAGECMLDRDRYAAHQICVARALGCTVEHLVVFLD